MANPVHLPSAQCHRPGMACGGGTIIVANCASHSRRLTSLESAAHAAATLPIEAVWKPRCATVWHSVPTETPSPSQIACMFCPRSPDCSNGTHAAFGLQSTGQLPPQSTPVSSPFRCPSSQCGHESHATGQATDAVTIAAVDESLKAVAPWSEAHDICQLFGAPASYCSHR
eukprot:SAG22_NODE_1042_length_5883_cov_129.108575_8_plen_171_part_00